MTTKKIHPRYMTKARNLIFNRETLTGGDFSRRMGMNYHALRSQLFERGATPEVAYKAADVLDKWAHDCKAAATALRLAADRVGD